MSENGYGMSIQIVRRSVLPVLLLLTAVATYVVYQFMLADAVSPQLHLGLKKGFKTLLVVGVAFVLQRISGAVFLWYLENVAERTATRLDDEMIPLLRRLTTIAIWIVALLVVLPMFGVNISALITTLGITSLAIALAAQDTIANIISGFLIMIDRPFRIGDRIKLPSGEPVSVLDIGVRRSRFLGEDGSVIIVPNLDLSKSKIVNITYGEERRARGGI